LKSVRFKIEGMHCDSCAKTIASVVGAEAGVRGVEVSFETGEARVLYEPAQTDEARIAAVMAKPGFRVTGRQS
jgi:copper chaperone